MLPHFSKIPVILLKKVSGASSCATGGENRPGEGRLEDRADDVQELEQLRAVLYARIRALSPLLTSPSLPGSGSLPA